MTAQEMELPKCDGIELDTADMELALSINGVQYLLIDRVGCIADIILDDLCLSVLY